MLTPNPKCQNFNKSCFLTRSGEGLTLMCRNDSSDSDSDDEPDEHEKALRAKQGLPHNQ